MREALGFDYEAANARLIELVEMREADPARVADILRVAVRLIRDGWCRRVAARDAAGNRVRAADDSAVCFCAGGAISRACIDLDASWQDGLSAQRLIEALTRQNITEFNDDLRTTQDHVEMAFLRAIHRIQHFDHHKRASA